MRGRAPIERIFPTSIESKPEQQGHRNVHLTRRDDAIAIRFYFYHHIKRLRYDDILLKLEIEFYLTPNMLMKRLNDRTDLMKELSKKDTKISNLKKILPYYNWN
jgi:hypothetical protein